jgi:flagellar motor switch/type III secretory pathway protein FliN
MKALSLAAMPPPSTMPRSTLPSKTSREWSAQRPSRSQFLAALPRLNATAVAVRNRIYSTPAVMLSDQRVLVWQDCPAVHAMGELVCRLGAWPVAIAGDNLARIEPRLEGFETLLPAEALGVLVENALSPIVTMVERLAGNSVVYEAFRRGAPPDLFGSEISAGFMVFEPDMQPLMRGWMRADAEVWKQMDFSRVLALPCRRVREVPLRLSIQIGKSRLKLRELRSLDSGDALRLTPRMPRHATSLKVVLGAPGSALSIHAGVAGDALTLERIVNTTAEFQNADADLPVTFELGSLRLKVADIGRLRAGQTLRLGVRLQEQPVRVMVNGRWIARGELAAVGDELVVVVTDTSRLPQV